MGQQARANTRKTLGKVVMRGRTRSIELAHDGNRLEIRVGNAVALIQFSLDNGRLAIVHTEVPPPFRGEGLGEALARAALDLARNRQWLVEPYCPFVANFITRHREYLDLVSPGFELASSEDAG